MSSTYYALCTAHDPSIVISGSGCEYSPEEILKETSSGIYGHEHCPKVIMRVSAAPIGFACLGSEKSPCGGHKLLGSGQGNLEWVDIDWLRLLSYFEPDDPRSEIQKIFKRRPMSCWIPDTVYKLRNRF